MSRVCFLFPGQGSQAMGMGKDFCTHSSLAKGIFEEADDILDFKLSKLCFEGPEEELRLTQNTQPALLTVSYIAYRLLEFEPTLAAGHSLGEYSALVAAGSLSFQDALLLVHRRGRYMQEAVPVGVGAMAAVLGAKIEDLRSSLEKVKEGVVEVANWNSQEQIVIAGRKDAVEEALKNLNPPRAIMLPVSAPFHTSLMKSAEEKLAGDLDRVKFQDLKFPIVTNVDARIIHKGEEAREALKRQVSRPVLWWQSMEVLCRENIETFVELGSGKVLSGLLRRISRSWTRPIVSLNVEDWESLENVRNMLRKDGNGETASI